MPRRPDDAPTPTINLVLARIQGSYLPGLQRCYVKHGLSHDPSLVAKVSLGFTVDDTGAATDNQARGATPEVDGCIRDQMAGWRFPVPKDSFHLSLALQPN